MEEALSWIGKLHLPSKVRSKEREIINHVINSLLYKGIREGLTREETDYLKELKKLINRQPENPQRKEVKKDDRDRH